MTGTAGTGPSKRVGACTILSQDVREPLAGTAYTRDRWLLIEHPGPWPSGAVEEVLDQEILDAVRDRDPAIRITLIRRPGVRTVDRPLVFYVDGGLTDRFSERTGTPAAGPVSGARAADRVTGTTSDAQAGAYVGADVPPPAIRRTRIDFYDDLRTLDFRDPDMGEPRPGPMFVVCTHGKREICCAEFGRPVIRALAQDNHDVWEITHIGGDRFAAAMIAFPHGHYFGRLNPLTAQATAASYVDGLLETGNLRGRSGMPNSAQVAELDIRHRTGLAGLDDVQVTAVEGDCPGQEASAVVHLSVRGASYRVELHREDFPDEVLNGCAPTSVPIIRRVWKVLEVKLGPMVG